MTATTQEFAPAKINLTLHVTGQRSDGYHLLDSLVVFADVGDGLAAQLGGPSLSVTGPFAQGVPTGPENSILKAAALIGIDGQFHLTKNLPHPAGIGGGSADAAAAVRALCHLTGQPLPPPQALLPLGADMPVCLSPRPQRMTSIGEDVTPVEALHPMWVVLVNPGVHTPTGPIFNALATKNNPPMGPVPHFASLHDQLAWLREQRNDLEPPARTLCPEIAEVLAAITATDAGLARMSGSGATCFGLYPSEDAANTAAAQLSRSNWWTRAAKVL